MGEKQGLLTKKQPLFFSMPARSRDTRFARLRTAGKREKFFP